MVGHRFRSDLARQSRLMIQPTHSDFRDALVGGGGGQSICVVLALGAPGGRGEFYPATKNRVNEELANRNDPRAIGWDDGARTVRLPRGAF